jgi:hypothetical protein
MRRPAAIPEDHHAAQATAAVPAIPDTRRKLVSNLPIAISVVPGEAEAVLRAIADELEWILKGR